MTSHNDDDDNDDKDKNKDNDGYQNDASKMIAIDNVGIETKLSSFTDEKRRRRRRCQPPHHNGIEMKSMHFNDGKQRYLKQQKQKQKQQQQRHGQISPPNSPRSPPSPHIYLSPPSKKNDDDDDEKRTNNQKKQQQQQEPELNKNYTEILRKAAVGVAGGALITVGIPLIPLPGPGDFMVVGGLALLATEFPAAKKVLIRGRDELRRAVEECDEDEDKEEVRFSKVGDGDGAAAVVVELDDYVAIGGVRDEKGEEKRRRAVEECDEDEEEVRLSKSGDGDGAAAAVVVELDDYVAIGGVRDVKEEEKRVSEEEGVNEGKEWVRRYVDVAPCGNRYGSREVDDALIRAGKEVSQAMKMTSKSLKSVARNHLLPFMDKFANDYDDESTTTNAEEKKECSELFNDDEDGLMIGEC
eukprot:CAMPEP_0172520926 /NCGR_PEP_ID=MMETSP1066-20121228/292279_1 /TAXON_ID=671091 /ORGANISM="Coscinodiscus wailesii, Strain CCMP2513" /LENGTH=411 /DNA_ID=CAMNT_0013303745 /DNA_START=63 /DNA_END=1298 /DNA_ORIENTATION=+